MPTADSTVLSEVPMARPTGIQRAKGAPQHSDSRYGPAIDHVLCTGDRSRSRRDQESNEVRDLLWLGGAAERNAAEALHDDLFAPLVVRTGLDRQALREGDRRFGFDPAGSN